VRLSLDLRSGFEANQGGKMAKREHLQPLERELEKIQDISEDILQSFLYQRDREAEHRNTNGECRVGGGFGHNGHAWSLQSQRMLVCCGSRCCPSV
jgi:hypothetical protein